jgi:S-adenosylmethionine:tRNA ribosyltransferase-isomerase
MKLNDFSFNLPKSLISFYPYYLRSHCRLMIVNGETSNISHKRFFNIIDNIHSGDLIILNNTKVIPARCIGYKKNGVQVECLVERIVKNDKILVSFKNSKNIQIGNHLFFGNNLQIKSSIVAQKKDFFEILFQDNKHSATNVINNIGTIPLPPYIKRSVNQLDIKRYQTVYSKKTGSVAAPTAGLHFDVPLLEQLNKKGIDIEYLTLHIGSGTFKPVRTMNIQEHIIHSEVVSMSSSLINKIKSCKLKGGRVIAVGTSTLRALESVYHSDSWKNITDFKGETKIFIYPGYQHNIVDALITNFHFPKSTLIMLVASFLGYKNTMNAYHEAIKRKYRFFSYGDAMYITYNKMAPYEVISS